MNTEQKQKKILFAGLTILVISGIFLYSASFLDRNTTAIQTAEIDKKKELTGAAAYSATLPPKSAGVPELCPAYVQCGGAISSRLYFRKGIWNLDQPRNPRGGDVQTVLPWSIPIQAIA